MSTSLVSVIVPCYNAAPWLADTLASARAQASSSCRIEIILVDDGSTDASFEIATGLAGPDLRLLRQPNSGASAARQLALAEAQGDFIQYLDADDLLSPGKISRQLARLASVTPGTVASARWVRFSGAPPGLAEALSAPPEPNWHDHTPIDYLTLTFRTGGMMHPAAWLSPRQVIERAGPWIPSLSLDDDGEYFTRVVLASEGIVHCDDAVSLYRSNVVGSLSGHRTAAAWRSAFQVCKSSTSALLALADTSETRAACALYWLRLAFASYPDNQAVTDEAEAHAKSLDPGARMPSAGPLFDRAARLIGWRCARRLQRLRARLLAPLSSH